MRLEDKVLSLLKKKPLLMSELQEKLQLSTVELLSVLVFLQKYKLVNGGDELDDTMIKITSRGRQLLNLPSLPEDETTALSEISEATINRIREREEERQQKIAEATK